MDAILADFPDIASHDISGLDFCAVCKQFDPEDYNDIVFCSGCNLCVHQICGGIEAVPDGDWYCAVCAVAASQGAVGEAAAPVVPVVCAACHQTGGAFNRVAASAADEAPSFVHTVCVNHIPMLYWSEPINMAGVAGLADIPVRLSNLACQICGKPGGTCIYCKHRGCKITLHPGCALDGGCDLNLKITAKGEADHGIFCLRHRKAEMPVELAAHLYQQEKAKFKAQYVSTLTRAVCVSTPLIHKF